MKVLVAADGSSTSGMMSRAKNKNHVADVYLKQQLDYFDEELRYKIMRLDMERLDLIDFLKKLKECDSDLISNVSTILGTWPPSMGGTPFELPPVGEKLPTFGLITTGFNFLKWGRSAKRERGTQEPEEDPIVAEDAEETQFLPSLPNDPMVGRSQSEIIGKPQQKGVVLHRGNTVDAALESLNEGPKVHFVMKTGLPEKRNKLPPVKGKRQALSTERATKRMTSPRSSSLPPLMQRKMAQQNPLHASAPEPLRAPPGDGPTNNKMAKSQAGLISDLVKIANSPSLNDAFDGIKKRPRNRKKIKLRPGFPPTKAQQNAEIMAELMERKSDAAHKRKPIQDRIKDFYNTLDFMKEVAKTPEPEEEAAVEEFPKYSRLR